MKPLEDERARALLAALPEPRTLGPAAFARVRARLDAAHPRRFRALHVALAAVLLASSVLAGTVLVQRVQRTVPTPIAPRQSPAEPQPLRAAETQALPELPREAPRDTRPAPLSAKSSEPEGALARESKLLAEAMTAMRKQHDAVRALRLLDEYRASFPQGTLAGEATVLRVEALLALGRSAEALGILERAPLERLPRTLELWTLRGELRGSEGRCADAIGDFNRVLAAAANASLAERALYGRASCRARTGDLGAARRDYEAYLVRFPGGRFSSKVKAALGSSP